MRQRLYFIFCSFTIWIIAGSLLAADHHEEKPQMTGFLADFAGQIYFVQGRILELEQAFPEDKFSWRPAEGVRSVAEVYMHIAGANYYLVKMSGQEIPSDIDMGDDPQMWEKSVSGKEDIKKILDRSFEDVSTAVQKIKVADLEKMVKVFGMEMTMRNFMLSMLSHMHEHHGQAIAYARTNGVIPPWSVKQQESSGE